VGYDPIFPKKITPYPTFSQYFARFSETFATSLFQEFSRDFNRLSTALDRQITPQLTTFQQRIPTSAQLLHSFFLLRYFATFATRGSTISIPRNLWQNLATSVRNTGPRAGFSVEGRWMGRDFWFYLID
jgi:hypothetical protein